jgi:hypothetical protein
LSWLSQITGGDAASRAGDQAKLSKDYQASAAQGYGSIQQQGLQNSGLYGANFVSLLNQLGSVGGFGNNEINPGQTQGAVAGQPTTGGRPVPTAPGGTKQGQYDAAHPGQNTGATDPNSPYALNQNQQVELNNQLGVINQRGKAASADLQQRLANSGITGAAAAGAMEDLQQHYAGLAQQTQATFSEQARQQKMDTLKLLLGQIVGAGQMGFSEQADAASGLGQLGGAAANQSNVSAQQSSAQLGSLLNLIGFGVGGGFGGGAGAAAGGAAASGIVPPVGNEYFGSSTFGSSGLGGGN